MKERGVFFFLEEGKKKKVTVSLGYGNKKSLVLANSGFRFLADILLQVCADVLVGKHASKLPDTHNPPPVSMTASDSCYATA
jgi:hypothetical protein